MSFYNGTTTPKTKEEASVLVREIEELEKRLAEKKGKLKEYFEVSSNTSVRGATHQFDYQTVEVFSVEPYKVGALLKYIALMDENPYSFVKVDFKKLFALEQEWFTEDVAKRFAVKKDSKRLTSSKIK